MVSRPQRILVIAGPTASGKTARAVDLALRLGGELIGADSVQVYRRLDQGSAKPSSEELRGVAHHLLDVVDLDAHFDAALFAAHADRAIAEVRARGNVPIVVGGAGLYLRALEAIRSTQKLNLAVDCQHLASFPQCGRLYAQLVQYPQEIVPIMDLVVHQL